MLHVPHKCKQVTVTEQSTAVARQSHRKHLRGEERGLSLIIDFDRAGVREGEPGTALESSTEGA